VIVETFTFLIYYIVLETSFYVNNYYNYSTFNKNKFMLVSWPYLFLLAIFLILLI